MSELPQHPHGRVEADGTVYVTDRGEERQVGQYPDGSPEEALAYFVRKFDDLAGQVALLEQRVRSGANPGDVAKAVDHLREQLDGANAVGDLEAQLFRELRVGAVHDADGSLEPRRQQLVAQGLALGVAQMQHERRPLRLVAQVLIAVAVGGAQRHAPHGRTPRRRGGDAARRAAAARRL